MQMILVSSMMMAKSWRVYLLAQTLPHSALKCQQTVTVLWQSQVSVS